MLIGEVEVSLLVLVLHLSLFCWPERFVLLARRTELLGLRYLLALLFHNMLIIRLKWPFGRDLFLRGYPLRRLQVWLLTLLRIVPGKLIAIAVERGVVEPLGSLSWWWHLLVRHRIHFCNEREIGFVVRSVWLSDLQAWFIFVTQRVRWTDHFSPWEPWARSLHLLDILLDLLEVCVLENPILFKKSTWSHISQYEVRNALKRVIFITSKSVNFVAFFLMNYNKYIRLKLLV